MSIARTGDGVNDAPALKAADIGERSSGLEFRFVPEGPAVAPEEWQACLTVLEGIDCEYLLASGSLPRGVPEDFYVTVAEIAARRGAKLILDTSGEALRTATARGVYLIKPSLGELEELIGRRLPNTVDQEHAVRGLIESGAAEIIALTLGRDGALLATRNGLRRFAGVKVQPKSAVGAGDSFLAAMTLALAGAKRRRRPCPWCGSRNRRAVLTMGTELSRREDVERIYTEIKAAGASAAA